MNARTDTYLLNLPNKLEETLKRIALYEKAGIDAIFIPCLTSMEDTQMITQAATLPVNVMCMPDLPSFKELRQAGISRISSGNFVQEALMKSFRKILHQTLKDQSYKSIFN